MRPRISTAVAGAAVWALLTTAAAGAPAEPSPEVALTFDDATDSEPINSGILTALAEAKIRSVLFVAGGHVNPPQGLAQVRRWGTAGHLVANHSYSHRSLGNTATTLPDFQADVLRNEALLRELPGFTRLFRYPFLREGETAGKRDGFRAFLRERGYRHGPVTIDASDWYYSMRFRAWQKRHPGADPAPFRAAYLAHLWDRTMYYDGLARKVLGRSVKHTLLLHTNEINAAFLPDVIRMYRDRNWKVIAAAAAFQDPVHREEPRILPAGQSVIWGLAKAKGHAGLRFPGENDTYEQPILDAAGL
jgi:peptidoglycan/xylan/chitin deacetylase (PgdA/CDA1 family)